ncbi:MAG: hypothetical protein WAV95_13410 [Azonexus sp.]
MLALGLGYSLYLTANASGQRNHRAAALAATLLRAKEALLARAVNDQNRPGSLPCPDRLTDSQEMNNRPDDGKADMLAGNRCPSDLGWLPWLTLDLPELSDETGNHLWYALSPSLRDDDSAQPINSATAMSLKVDDQDDIAAIIIAPGGPIGQQRRPSDNPADYLESQDGLNNTFSSGPPTADFNDTVMVITRAEIMAAVGKRLAGELRNCLEQHADSSANPEHRYPWPAPLDATLARGNAGSHFGRIADTQPDGGPEAALRNNLERLDQARRQLADSPDAQQQLQALKTLGDATLQARQLFDAIYLLSSKLRQSADEASALLQPLTATIDSAIDNGRISRSEGSAIRAHEASSTQVLEKLPALLGEFGTDLFPGELSRRSAAVGEAKTPKELLDRISALHALLAISYSARADLAPPLAAASSTAASAEEAALAAAQTGDAITLKAAKSAASTLLETTDSLGKAVAASRINLPAKQLDDFSRLLEELDNTLTAPSWQDNLDALLDGLMNTRRVVESIHTGLPNVASARNASIESIDTAIFSARSAQPNRLDIRTNIRQAGAQTNLLSVAIAANEASDNNLSRSSLHEALRSYSAAHGQFAGIDTATPRPLQSAIIPYAESLGAATANIATWLDIIATHSSTAAPLAKADAASSEQAIATALPLDSSAYAAANGVLDSISGSRKSAATVQSYIQQPNDENRSKARAGIAETLERTERLLSQASQLADNIKSSTASAFPMIWNSGRCDFLRPGQASWWHDNRWSETLFYQISAPLKAAPGTLTVDASGKFRLIVLAAGPRLTGQGGNIATIANFLEGMNASPTRNGQALSPIPHFSGAAPGRDFNDRLAY